MNFKAWDNKGATYGFPFRLLFVLNVCGRLWAQSTSGSGGDSFVFRRHPTPPGEHLSAGVFTYGSGGGLSVSSQSAGTRNRGALGCWRPGMKEGCSCNQTCLQLLIRAFARCTLLLSGQHQFRRSDKGFGNVAPLGECYSPLRNAASLD